MLFNDGESKNSKKDINELLLHNITGYFRELIKSLLEVEVLHSGINTSILSHFISSAIPEPLFIILKNDNKSM